MKTELLSHTWTSHNERSCETQHVLALEKTKKNNTAQLSYKPVFATK